MKKLSYLRLGIKVSMTALLLSSIGGTAKGEDNKQIQEGREVFNQAHCYACHGDFGTGTLGPALSGDHMLIDPGFVITMILLGRKEMPSFAHKLSNEQIAAVAEYIRNSWGNAYGSVTPQDVAKMRQNIREASKKSATPQMPSQYPQR
jgi:mono/diheme cytochrome c family protein